MRIFRDVNNRDVRLTDERYEHLMSDHPEMAEQIDKVRETLLNPGKVVRSRTDPQVELFYQFYQTTPVTQKFLCVVVKAFTDDAFIITAYFTSTIKQGEMLWEKK